MKLTQPKEQLQQNFESLQKKLNEIHKVIKTEKINDIYYNHEISNDFVFVIKYMNIQLGNHEHKMINILVDGNYIFHKTCYDISRKSGKVR